MHIHFEITVKNVIYCLVLGIPCLPFSFLCLLSSVPTSHWPCPLPHMLLQLLVWSYFNAFLALEPAHGILQVNRALLRDSNCNYGVIMVDLSELCTSSCSDVIPDVILINCACLTTTASQWHKSTRSCQVTHHLWVVVDTVRKML